ncbi:mitogen-activated protein kinase kinase kinase 7 isoform X1 [Drosophila mauritiana]|uniref:Mitogen-activated protein kinase kinase kinase 7 isoform X1 n=1 Tax=Drosophila mauritiana TaxID=7226 RepID=A0A6P8KLJ5_DROMA|nr:mitogen-activated protein kinase kinase kinase 7 isoform X1 [Drosophila mauritiana]
MAATVEGVPYEEIQTKELIGTGFYGSVYKAIWRNREIALKRIREGCEDKKIEREIYQLTKASHVNIVQLYGTSRHEGCALLLMELVDGGSLSSFLHAESKPSYSHAHAFNWAHQIAQGIAYLHGMQPKAVIHRDIKPLNTLLCEKGLKLKICDFGTVVDLSQSISCNAGTCRYKAPEVLQGNKPDEKCDVYSWAITFWEILSRKEPFEQYNTLFELYMAINEGERPDLSYIMAGCPADIVALLSACWDPDISKRFSMELISQSTGRILSQAGHIPALDFYA